MLNKHRSAKRNSPWYDGYDSIDTGASISDYHGFNKDLFSSGLKTRIGELNNAAVTQSIYKTRGWKTVRFNKWITGNRVIG